jgi:adenylate kinase
MKKNSNMKYQLIVLFGPPGCGKGTQALILDKRHSYLQLGMSKLLDQYIEVKSSKNTLLDPKTQTTIEDIRKQLSNGGLVSFDHVVDIMEESFNNHIKDGEIMTLDGFPRTANQALWLSGLICKEKCKTLFVHFDLGLREVQKRIETRWFVEGSNLIYSSKEAAIEQNPGKQPFRRELDKDPSIIVKRYNEQYGDQKQDIIDGIKNNPFVDMLELDAGLSVATLEDIIGKKLIY